jgi:hypothetical protein
MRHSRFQIVGENLQQGGLAWPQGKAEEERKRDNNNEKEGVESLACKKQPGEKGDGAWVGDRWWLSGKRKSKKGSPHPTHGA